MMQFKLWLELQTPQAVLVAIGAYNPMHRGHLRAIYHAKTFLETKRDTDIIAAYIVPKNQAYVDRKAAEKGEPAVPEEDRIQAIELALHGTFIKLLPIDIEHGPLSDQQIRATVQNMHPDKEVIMVVGDDYVKCPNNQRPPCIVDLHNDYGTQYVAPRAADNFSSTAAQTMLRRGEDTPMLAPQVLNFIKNKGLWGYRR